MSDDGATWELLPGDFRTFSDVWVSPSGRAFFVGNDDDIWAYDGSNWQSITLSPTAFGAISGTSDDDIVVAALANVTWHFDGETWQSRNTGVSQNLNDLWVSEVHGTYGVGNRATVIRYDGQAWLRVPLDIRQPGTLQCPDLIAVHGSDAGGPVAVGTNGLRVRPKASP